MTANSAFVTALVNSLIQPNQICFGPLFLRGFCIEEKEVNCFTNNIITTLMNSDTPQDEVCSQ